MAFNPVNPNQGAFSADGGFDAYKQQGARAANVLEDAYGRLMDPTSFMNSIMNGYKPSDAYQFQLAQATKEIGNTAAAGGIAGTPLH